MSTSSTPDIGDDIEDFDFFGWWESFANSPISPFDLIPVDTVDTAEVVASSFSFWAEHAPLDGYIAADPSDDIILSQTQQPDTITRSQREQSVMVISDDETMRKTRVEKQQPRNFKTRSRARGTRQRKSRTGREAQPTGPRRSQRKRSQPASYRTVMMFDFDEVILLD